MVHHVDLLIEVIGDSGVGECGRIFVPTRSHKSATALVKRIKADS